MWLSIIELVPIDDPLVFKNTNLLGELNVSDTTFSHVIPSTELIKEPEKSKSVVITSDGEVIRTLDDGTVKSTSNTDETITDENNIMWDFKLKQTRVIFFASIIYSIFFYWFGIEEDVLDELWYWSWMSPVFIYWVVIPSYRWIMKGK